MIRRRHAKSRRGCAQCKRKHIKCDEVQPRCQHCVRSDIACEWPIIKPAAFASPGGSSAGQQATASHSVASSSGSPNALQQTARPQLAVQDLRLLHHWILHTSYTLATEQNHFFWQNGLVDLGFRFPFLLRTMLAVAAAHIAAVRPDEAAAMHNLALTHLDEAMPVFRKHIENPDPATCSPTFVTASLLVIYGLGVAHVGDDVDPILEMASSFRLTRGIVTLTQMSWARMSSLEIAPMISCSQADRDLRDAALGFDMLEDRVHHLHTINSPSRETCLHAIAQLRMVSANCKVGLDVRKSTRGILFNWPACLEASFVDLISQKDTAALLTLAIFVQLFKLVGTSWPTGDLDERILRTIRNQVGHEDSMWIDRMWREIESR